MRINKSSISHRFNIKPHEIVLALIHRNTVETVYSERVGKKKQKVFTKVFINYKSI